MATSHMISTNKMRLSLTFGGQDWKIEDNVFALRLEIFLSNLIMASHVGEG